MFMEINPLGSGNGLIEGPELGGEVRFIQHDWVKKNEVGGRVVQ